MRTAQSHVRTRGCSSQDGVLTLEAPQLLQADGGRPHAATLCNHLVSRHRIWADHPDCGTPAGTAWDQLHSSALSAQERLAAADTCARSTFGS